MTTYNGEKYIGKQLRSLLEQTKQADEVVIQDDCSTDRTAKIVTAFIHEYKLDNWQFSVNSKNLGFKRNFYETIQQTTGDIIFLCDQDDIWNPNKVKRMEAIFTENSAVLSINSSFSFIDSADNPFSVVQKKNFSNNNLIQTKRPYRPDELVKIGIVAIINSNISPGCTTAFRKEVRNIYLEQSTCEIAHDWEINIIAASLGGLYYYHTPLIRYRIHDQNTLGLGEIVEQGKDRNPAQYEERLRKARQWYANITLFEKYNTFLSIADRQTFLRYKKFFRSRLRALERRNVLMILLLYRYGKQYRSFITWKGRLADIACTILPASKE